MMRRSLTVFLLIILAGLTAGPLSADTITANIAELTPVEDAYVDLLNPTTNYDQQPLEFSVKYLRDDSGPMPVYCPEVTQIVYVKFDLNEVDFEIAKARLNVKTIASDQVVHDSVFLMGSEDSWNEKSLVWYGKPQFTAGPLTGSAENVENGRSTWTDYGSAQNTSLAHWLESQRTSDGVATLAFNVNIIVGCWPGHEPPTNGEVEFAIYDKLSLYPPQLGLADANSDLPGDSDPSAVTFSSLSTDEPNAILPINFLIILLLTMLVLVQTRLRHVKS